MGEICQRSAWRRLEESLSGSLEGGIEVTPLIEFMETLKRTAEENCCLGSEVSLDELPAGGGIYAEPGEGSTADTTYNKAEMKTIPVLFLCRNESQQKCLEQLESICNYFQKLKKHPNGESFSWLNTEIAKYPSKIGRDEDGTYHYSCILRCLLYF
ncbi:hypothetical protein DWZ08_06275 [Clostridiaceae bacterium AF29-16BH]|nr:hypothetical protein DWZ08_06275 [Clostridiaceae bacterium AF29-16BH]